MMLSTSSPLLLWIAGISANGSINNDGAVKLRAACLKIERINSLLENERSSENIALHGLSDEFTQPELVRDLRLDTALPYEGVGRSQGEVPYGCSIGTNGEEGRWTFRGKVRSADCIRLFQQSDNSSLPYVLFIVSFIDSIHLSNRSKFWMWN